MRISSVPGRAEPVGRLAAGKPERLADLVYLPSLRRRTAGGQRQPRRLPLDVSPHPPPREFSRAALGIYLLIQIVAMLFGSCGYRGAYYDPYYYRNYSYSDSGTYSGQNQSQTGSDTGSGSWY